MQSDLFRKEALQARRQSWLGRVQSFQPLSFRLVAGLTLAFVLVTILYAVFGSYTRRVHATGLLLPSSGLITISSRVSGMVVMRQATEGMHVRKGDKLFVLDLESSSEEGPTQKRILGELKRQLDLLKQQKILRAENAPVEKRALAVQIRYLSQKHEQIKKQLENDAHVLPIIEKVLHRMELAEKQGLITNIQFQNQLYTYTQLLNNHAQFLQSDTETQSKMAELASQLIQFDNKLAHDLNDLARQISQIEQRIAENEGRRNVIIFAPDNGVLTAIRTDPGQVVAVGTPMATLLPDGHVLEAELYVSSASIGFLQQGEPVLLRYAAFPYQRFGLYRGRVREITRAPVTVTGGPVSVSKTASSGGGAGRGKNVAQNIYRIRVMPDQQFVDAYGKKKLLQAGMEVEADIAVDTRRLYQWIFDPVISTKDDFYAVSGGLAQ